MNLEVQTTLLNTYPPTLITTILKAFREKLKENDQLNAVEKIAGPAPEIPNEKDQSFTDGGGFWDDEKGGYLPENLVLAARREEIAWVHSEGVSEIVLVQKYLQMQTRNCWISSGWTQTSLWTPVTRKFDRDCAREYKTKKQGKMQRTPLAAQLFSAMPLLEAVKVLVSIIISVGWSNKGKPLKLRHYDIRRAHKEQPRDSCMSAFLRKTDRGMVKTKLAD